MNIAHGFGHMLQHQTRMVRALGDCHRLGLRVLHCELTGSAAFGKPNPNDYDIILLVTEPFKDTHLQFVLAMLLQDGWHNCAEDSTTVSDREKYGFGERVIVRKGDVNLQFYTDEVEYAKALGASLVTKRFIEDGRFSWEERERYVRIFRALRGEDNG